MERLSLFSLIWSVTVLFLINSTVCDATCNTGEYFNTFISTCQSCSTCPDGEIARELCSKDRDTVCGPFYEFGDFLLELSESIGTTPSPEEAQHVASNENTWYALTFILIGVLCVTSTLMVILVVVMFVMCRRRRLDKVIDTESRYYNINRNSSSGSKNNNSGLPSFVDDMYVGTEDKVALVTKMKTNV